MSELEQGAEVAESPAAESNTPNQAQAMTAQAQAQGSESQEQHKPSDVPFHEHPRFKELVEQKNQFASQFKDSQKVINQLYQKLQSLEQSSQAQRAQEDALHARLKGIDPEFGERFSKLDGSLKELEQLKAWKQEMEMNQVRQQGVQMVNDLHTQNKVSKEMQDIYNSQIETMVRGNPNLGLRDLPEVYKDVHERMSKVLDSIKRTERESYVQGKKQDASTPASPKQPPGNKAANSKGFEYSKDPLTAKHQLVQNIRQAIRAERE
ncbi:MAG: hypothetical protein KGL39_51315 [Patescibacteria group bacterium]|nr:hypothetical protein [Patescibacteria group bacterium]